MTVLMAWIGAAWLALSLVGAGVIGRGIRLCDRIDRARRGLR